MTASILGINENVEIDLPHRPKRDRRLLNRSSDSAVSDDADTTKFQVFQILGNLDYFPASPSQYVKD